MYTPYANKEPNIESKDVILCAAQNFNILPSDISISVNTGKETIRDPLIEQAWNSYKEAAATTGRQAFDGEIYSIFDDSISLTGTSVSIALEVGHYSDFRMFPVKLAAHAGHSDQDALQLAALKPSDAIAKTASLYNPDLHPGICSVASLIVTHDGDLVLGKASGSTADPDLLHFIGGAFSRSERLKMGLDDPQDGDDIAVELHREFREELGIDEVSLASRFGGIIKSPNGENRILFVTYANYTTEELVAQSRLDHSGELSDLFIIHNEDGNWNYSQLSELGGCFREMANIVEQWDDFVAFREAVTRSPVVDRLGKIATE